MIIARLVVPQALVALCLKSGIVDSLGISVEVGPEGGAAGAAAGAAPVSAALVLRMVSARWACSMLSVWAMENSDPIRMGSSLMVPVVCEDRTGGQFTFGRRLLPV